MLEYTKSRGCFIMALFLSLFLSSSVYAQFSGNMPSMKAAPRLKVKSKATTYLYTAETKERARKQGKVKAGKLSWQCMISRCTVTGSWATPGVSACNTLAKEVGRIKSYGHSKKKLTSAQLTQCNAGISNVAVKKLPEPQVKTKADIAPQVRKTPEHTAKPKGLAPQMKKGFPSVPKPPSLSRKQAKMGVTPESSPLIPAKKFDKGLPGRTKSPKTASAPKGKSETGGLKASGDKTPFVSGMVEREKPKGVKERFGFLPDLLITGFTPRAVWSGNVLMLRGYAFGDAAEGRRIKIASGGREWFPRILDWSEDRIKVQIPEDVPTGDYDLGIVETRGRWIGGYLPHGLRVTQLALINVLVEVNFHCSIDVIHHPGSLNVEFSTNRTGGEVIETASLRYIRKRHGRLGREAYEFRRDSIILPAGSLWIRSLGSGAGRFDIKEWDFSPQCAERRRVDDRGRPLPRPRDRAWNVTMSRQITVEGFTGDINIQLDASALPANAALPPPTPVDLE